MLNILADIMHNAIYPVILLNFILLIILIYWNWGYIWEYLRKINLYSWIFLLAFVVIAVLIRLYVSPIQHIMYNDEAMYMQAGKEIMQFGSQGDYPKSIGWPFILSIVFRIFGLSNITAIYASVFFGAMTIFALFLLAFIITRNQPVSLAASFMFSLFAGHIRWSTTAETSMASLFFMILSMFFALLCFKHKKQPLLWLAAAGIAFAVQFRPENIFLLFIFLRGYMLYHPVKNTKRLFLPFILILVIILPNFVQVLSFQTSQDWLEQESGGEISGPSFGFSNLANNSLNYGMYLFNNEFQPYLFTLLMLIGLIYGLFKNRKDTLILAGWFAGLWFIYFFSYFQTLGGGLHIDSKIRFFLNFYPVSVIFMGYGMLFFFNILKKKLPKNIVVPFLAVILAFMFISQVETASHTLFSDINHLETIIPEIAEKKFENCTIIMNFPIILNSTTYLELVDIDYVLKHPNKAEKQFDTGCTLFFEDAHCTTWDTHGSKSKCRQFKKAYELDSYRRFWKGDSEFIFYRLS